ncbi:phage protein [Streptococcus pseudoporcinus]|uniref:Phage protein n=1 Tax=Streptococcus pseudoporcinus TaxID=361101 RepID=A0A4U9Y1Z2_9STRE|nr:phage head closure protein [Streptococcus pseudoporcinus]VTS13501.1 phage protein [Streptococcus pseudoporcinus]VTS20064.1 phage protein [Streptococcus pseudoporcinus]
MMTRKMNQRITFFSQYGGQNEDGEVLDAVRKDVYTCWAEVLKTQLRDFKLQYKDSLDNSKATKLFLIRYNPKIEIDNTMFVDYNKSIYKIDKVESNESDKDMTMISAVKIS